jgi:hypothetical protein
MRSRIGFFAFVLLACGVVAFAVLLSTVLASDRQGCPASTSLLGEPPPYVLPQGVGNYVGAPK